MDTNEDAFIAARGMAIKLLDVNGTPAIPGTDNRCQDFLTVNLPVFPFATPAEYLKLFEIRATPLAGDLLAVDWLALFHPGHLTSVMKFNIRITTPLVTNWGGLPYWFGPPGTGRGRTVKYSFVPRFKWTALHTDPKSNSERPFLLNEAFRTTMVAIANMTTQRIMGTLRTYLSRHLPLSAEIHDTFVAE